MLKSSDEVKKERQAGLTLRLECNAEHDINLSIKYEWFVNDKLLDVQNRLKDITTDESNSNLEHYLIDKNNSLVIKNLTQHDTG